MFLLELTKAFDHNHLDYALVGGLAVALHGAVRGTIDIDLIICLSEEDFIKAESTLNQLGLESKLPASAHQVFHFRKEYIESRNLIAWTFYHPKKPTQVVDIIITSDLKKMKVKQIQCQKQILKVLSIDDLIVMKLKSGRPQDLADVEALKSILFEKNQSEKKK